MIDGTFREVTMIMPGMVVDVLDLHVRLMHEMVAKEYPGMIEDEPDDDSIKMSRGVVVTTLMTQLGLLETDAMVAAVTNQYGVTGGELLADGIRAEHIRLLGLEVPDA